jgi:hypothetical protein
MRCIVVLNICFGHAVRRHAADTKFPAELFMSMACV